jgi:diadenylate cyclase
MLSFITIRFLDIVDILLVAALLYQIYRLIRGTVAFNIVIGFFLVYLVWVVVRSLGMELLSSIIGQFIGVGVLALIIVFHPEIRRFLLYIGSHNQITRLLSLDKLFHSARLSGDDGIIPDLVETASFFSRTRTGAIIIIVRRSELIEQINTGEILNARISQPLLKTIFFKNTPLHDGAVIIKNNLIVAAGCILPITHKEVEKSMGLRHRAAIGVTETTDAIAIVVSEESGNISLVDGGIIMRRLSQESLTQHLSNFLANNDQDPSPKT